MHCKLSVILALAVYTYSCDGYFISVVFLGTLDRFPGGDKMKDNYMEGSGSATIK